MTYKFKSFAEFLNEEVVLVDYELSEGQEATREQPEWETSIDVAIYSPDGKKELTDIVSEDDMDRIKEEAWKHFLGQYD